MQPNGQPLSLIRRIATKEVALFFASPIAYLFLATFAAVTLFIFFWGEAFFSRNIVDVRPMFEWMPLLLIFLASTLTMRLWSEERRTGTLEHVLTQPVPLWHFVVGKFVGCLLLLAIALAITLPLPISVSVMGDLDWGPVWAGYLATLLLGAAYLSIGLFVSARSDNQIVSLISAVALSGLFYLIGTNTITDFFGNQVGEWLRLLGTGSRFDAITRGVIDFRDLYYYFSMIAVFLALNTFVLEKERWATQQATPHHQTWRAVTGLLLANAIGANLWLGQINSIRMDATEGNQYSISEATTGYLNKLQEPLLVRGYFSSKTHPLLAPLVPQLRDLIEEYEVAGKGKVRVEFVDPITNPELEEEANQKYGIQPVPFQVADRYQASIVSSYFNVLVQYGDEHQVLGFRDLIEVKARSEADIDVQLRNPEHDLTRAIKKVLNSYQAGGNLFDTVKGELVFNGYISNESTLPEKLVGFKKTITKVLDKLKADANGRLAINFIDPDADGGKVGQQIAQDFGFKPMTTSLLSNDRFYFYLTLANQEEQTVQIPLGGMSEGNFKRNLEAGLKRFASGFTKTVALVAPQTPGYSPYSMGGGAKFSQLEKFLGDELNIKQEDLSDGRVSGEADILLLMSPKDLNEKQLFAIDQFLMQGGTIIAATSPYSASLSNRSLSLQKQNSGLQDWLAHHGLLIEDKIVMDPQNAAFPIPVTRNVGGYQFQEMRMLDYPYFIDVRDRGLNQDNAITADLPQTTVVWASPVIVDQKKQVGRKVTELLRSSKGAWLSSSMDIMPKITRNGLSAFTPEGKQGSQLLGVISAGRFNSYFADKDSPLLIKEDKAEETGEEAENTSDNTAAVSKQTTISSVISRSPESARIILFSSNDFLRDQVIRMAGSSTGSEYLNNLQLLANTVDWSLEDAGLLSIRARGHFNRTLPPMERNVRLFWEYLNYGLAILALGVIAIVQRQRKRARDHRYLALLAN
ncbi:Gldg family protein [Spartinivicinus ruber]|uniref:Gldg family protein n=1 Tax=Spartinivicinus ruber TaxID=2683272 RepID=UPI0013D360DB|nr:Gldg family protein [Spartinivicinus ruber]